MAAWVEKLTVKVRCEDAHIPKSWATEEYCNNEQVDQAAKVKLPQVNYFCLGRPMTPCVIWKEMQHYRWARDCGVDLTMDTISRLSMAVKCVLQSSWAEWIKPLWYGGGGAMVKI